MPWLGLEFLFGSFFIRFHYLPVFVGGGGCGGGGGGAFGINGLDMACSEPDICLPVFGVTPLMTPDSVGLPLGLVIFLDHFPDGFLLPPSGAGAGGAGAVVFRMKGVLRACSVLAIYFVSPILPLLKLLFLGGLI
jgi:hypothetical protein